MNNILLRSLVLGIISFNIFPCKGKIYPPSRGELIYAERGSSVKIKWTYDFGAAPIFAFQFYFENRTVTRKLLASMDIIGKTTVVSSMFPGLNALLPSTLKLPSVTTCYNGTFELEVVLIGLKTESSFVTLIVTVAPENLQFYSNKDVNIIESGATINITCEADGYPEPIFVISRNGARIKDGKYLNLEPASYHDSGNWTCIASNNYGKSSASFVLLVFVVPEKLTFRSTKDSNIVALGTSTNITCEAFGYPAPNFVILHNGTEIKDGKYVNLEAAIFNDTGNYTCIASNQFGNISAAFNLVVFVAPEKLQFRSSNDDNIVALETPINLTCEAVGYPAPSFVILHNGTYVKGVKYLKLEAAAFNNSGSYTCIASNDYGNSSASLVLIVFVVPEKIKFGSSKDGNSLALGTSTNITCEAFGYPEPSFLILHNGTHIKNGKHLNLEAAVFNDTGNYTCIASNMYGNSSSTFNLLVFVAPEKLQFCSSMDGNIVALGTSTNIICDAFGYPGPTFVILHNNSHVKDGKYLNLEEAAFNDTGNYTCIASNKYGNSSSSFNLIVFVAPEKIYFRSNNEGNIVALDTPINLTCEATGYPEPSFVILHNNTQIKDGKYHNIEAAIFNDTGNYTCIASNIYGNSSAILNLFVSETKKEEKKKSDVLDLYIIIIVVLILLLIFIFILWLLLRKKRRNRQPGTVIQVGGAINNQGIETKDECDQEKVNTEC